MISNAISEGNSFAFDSSCFEKWTESHSNGVLVCSSAQSFFTHTLMYKAVVVAFGDRSLHNPPPPPKKKKTDYLMKDSAEELIFISWSGMCERARNKCCNQSQTKHERSSKQVGRLRFVFIISVLHKKEQFYEKSKEEKKKSSLGCWVTFTIPDKLFSVNQHRS